MAFGQRRRILPVPAHWIQARTEDGAIPVHARHWRPLFDGTSLDGWVVEDKPNFWSAADGILRTTGDGGGYLRTVEQFGDFAVACEFNMARGANSGLFVRWTDPRDPVNTGIEAQIYDTAGKPVPDKHDCGAIYNLVAPSVNTAKPAGEWNRMVVSCQGPFISVRLNGVFIAEVDLSRYTTPGRNPDGSANKFTHAWARMPRRGFIGLQDHGGAVAFREIMTLPLPPP